MIFFNYVKVYEPNFNKLIKFTLYIYHLSFLYFQKIDIPSV